MKTPKECAIDFAKHTSITEPFIIEVPGDEDFAMRYVQRIRVAISRFRKQIRARKLSIKPFKLVITKLEYLPSAGITKIHVMRRTPDSTITDAVDDAFTAFSSGKRFD